MPDDGPDPVIALFVRQFFDRLEDAGVVPSLRVLRQNAIRDRVALGEHRQKILEACFYRETDTRRVKQNA